MQAQPSEPRSEGPTRASPAGLLLARIAGSVPAPHRADRLLAALCGALGFAAAALPFWLERHGLADFHDEYSYLLQARIFASGRLSWTPPALPEFFETLHVLVHPVYASKYAPGHSLLLAPFVALGVPWLLPALLLGGTCALLYVALRRVTLHPALASLAVALLLGSPVFVGCFATFLSHTSCTFLVVCALALSAGPRSRPVALGALAAAAFLVRPLTGVALAAAVVAHLALRRTPLRAAALFVLPVAAAVALNLGYNRALTGDARTSPWDLWARQYTPFDGMGLGPMRRDSPERALPPHVERVSAIYEATRREHTWTRLPQTVGQRLLKWVEQLPAKELLPLLLLGLGPALRSPASLQLLFAGCLFLLQLLFHATLPQYFNEMVPAFPILAVFGIRAVLGAIAGGAAAERRALALFAGLSLTHVALGLVWYEGTWFPALCLAMVPFAGLAAARGARWPQAGRGALAALVAVSAIPTAQAVLLAPTVLRSWFRDDIARTLEIRALLEPAVRRRALVFVRNPTADLPDLTRQRERIEDEPVLLVLDRGEDNRRMIALAADRPAFRLDVAAGTLVELVPEGTNGDDPAPP